MIFVTVGTHEQPFDRLVKSIDELKEKNIINEEVVIQTGYSTYDPKYCKSNKLYPYSEMVKYVSEARIVITHGGPSSFIMPLQVGKIPIVVPRQKQFDEHVNDHQVEFCKAVADRQRNIIVVEEIGEIENVIVNYDTIVKSLSAGLQTNNAQFNKKIEQIVEELFDKEK